MYSRKSYTQTKPHGAGVLGFKAHIILKRGKKYLFFKTYITKSNAKRYNNTIRCRKRYLNPNYTFANSHFGLLS